ncbi:signal recognition particle-docking protein FtsY [Anaerococcus hydrogenalis DSM 7454]|uniref:Signal recognition particle receptor FtsY n=1 Tax=Anaerococcus hydrogenalis DSM 7454 TaxID=561177 RepID=B6W802_9FIRM|nr:signal recognition particle-docking protein FtsY [Anaerococcus hydrogenalis]EEB36401.1 signal recognition particle-docking protein FtsY [Anaerococcus hydrogenalis DSM 7454]
MIFFKRKKNENEKQVESEIIEEVEKENPLEENEDENISEDINNTQNKEDEEKEIISEENEEELGFFEKLSKGLTKTREQFSSKLKNLFTANVKIDDDLYDELEEILISADIGMQSTIEIVDELKDKIKERSIKNADQIFPLLKEIMEDKLDEKNLDNELLISNDKLSVILVIGVNGVGKTTTIGKLAHNLKKEGHKVTLAAADTFRAAAIEQLDSWAKESNTQMIAHKEGSDPSAVIFDAIQAAKANGSDVLICDTAGRLHNKKNLMNELEKINRTISTHANNANRENLLVLDATTGQNAISQLREFKNVCEITGLILTKLDGTAKGGVIFPLQVELEVPVKYIGVGEGIDNLEKFDSKSFVKAMIE